MYKRQVDISVVVDGEPWSSNRFEIEHDMVVAAPTINVVTLGAGGGSIISATPEGDIATGPESAGAEPGPACYGDGGAWPTVTDAAAVIGILSADGFLGGRKALRVDLAREAFQRLDTPLSFADRVRYGWELAIDHIAEGIRNIAIRRGIDTRDFSLVAAGAAGPMLIPAVLDHVPLRRVVVPPHPGLFSALGLASTDRAYGDHLGRYLALGPHAAAEIDEIYRVLEERVRSTVQDQDGGRLVRTFDARYFGQSWETPLVEAPTGPIDGTAVEEMVERFRSAYEKVNGIGFGFVPVEAVAFGVQLVVPADKVTYPVLPDAPGPAVPSGETVLEHLFPSPVAAAEYQRADLGAGAEVAGPAVIREPLSTTFVPPGRVASVGAHGEIVIT